QALLLIRGQGDPAEEHRIHPAAGTAAEGAVLGHPRPLRTAPLLGSGDARRTDGQRQRECDADRVRSHCRLLLGRRALALPCDRRMAPSAWKVILTPLPAGPARHTNCSPVM